MRRTLIAVFLVMFFGGSALADEAKTVQLEPIVVTPWRAEQSLSDISKNVSVITQEDIKNSGARNLPEVIQNRSGVVVSDYFGNPKNAVVDIRGFGESSSSNVLVLVDGRRTNQVDLSGVDWAQIDLNSVERIEIVRGASTTLYGDNATAGVINIITKKGTTAKPSVKIAGELGSHKYRKGHFNLSGIQSLSGSAGSAANNLKYIDYFFSYSAQEDSGYRANNDYWANDYFARTDFYISDKFQLNLSGGYHSDRYGMPGALYLADIDSIGRRGTIFPNDRGSVSDLFVAAEPKLSFLLGNNSVDLSVFASSRKRRSKGLNIWTIGLFEFETVHNITSYELRPKLQTSLLWKDIDNKLVIGADYFHAKDNVLSGNRIADQQDETGIYKETFGLYIHDNMKISDVFLMNAGGRIEWADYKFNQKRLIENYDRKKINNAAFNFGTGYKYNKKSQVYFDISRSYRFPNTEEYYQNKTVWSPGGLNIDLNPQQAMNYEIGLRDISFDWLNLGINGFLMDVKNEIYYDPTTDENSNYRPKTRRYGIEAEAKLTLVEGKLNPFINWTLQESFFKGGEYAGNQVPFVPKNKISAGITIMPLDGLNWTTGLNYVGSRYKISDQKNLAPKLKSYVTVDTRLGYDYKFVNIWGGIKNIFGKKYYAYGVTNSTGTAETFYPAPERRFEAGMSLTF